MPDVSKTCALEYGMTEWNGDERREMPHRYEVLEMLREEMEG
jgi:hypothetical protein